VLEKLQAFGQMICGYMVKMIILVETHLDLAIMNIGKDINQKHQIQIHLGDA